MFGWLRKKKKESTHKYWVFNVIPKEDLINDEYYEGFCIKQNNNMKITSAKWNSEVQKFVWFSKIIDYNDFLPIKQETVGPKYKVLNYDPADLTVDDIEELKEIVYSCSDETTVESDDIWEKLMKYFEKRGML